MRFAAAVAAATTTIAMNNKKHSNLPAPSEWGL